MEFYLSNTFSKQLRVAMEFQSEQSKSGIKIEQVEVNSLSPFGDFALRYTIIYFRFFFSSSSSTSDQDIFAVFFVTKLIMHACIKHCWKFWTCRFEIIRSGTESNSINSQILVALGATKDSTMVVNLDHNKWCLGGDSRTGRSNKILWQNKTHII